MLYYCLYALMVVAGFSLNTVPCTLVYSVAILVYNEGGLATNPVLKNIIGALSLACYPWGTIIIMGKDFTPKLLTRANSISDHGRELQGFKALAVLIVFAIFATTVSPVPSISIEAQPDLTDIGSCSGFPGPLSGHTDGT